MIDVVDLQHLIDIKRQYSYNNSIVQQNERLKCLI